jgi:hypothetical protein
MPLGANPGLVVSSILLGSSLSGEPRWDSDTKLDVRSPRWGPGQRQLLATLYVTFSLALFALGGADPDGGFYLRSLSFSRPVWGPFWIRFPYPTLSLRHRACDVQGIGET